MKLLTIRANKKVTKTMFSHQTKNAHATKINRPSSNNLCSPRPPLKEQNPEPSSDRRAAETQNNKWHHGKTSKGIPGQSRKILTVCKAQCSPKLVLGVISQVIYEMQTISSSQLQLFLLLNLVLGQRGIFSLETNLNSTSRTLCYENTCSTMQTTLKKQFCQESRTGFNNRKGKQWI